MNYSMYLRFPIFAILMFLLAAPDAQGQLIKRRYYKTYETRPDMLLVQLPTYGRREAYLNKRKNPKQIAQLQQDKTEMVQRILMDFKDNFSFCPVYFFYDTHAAQVRQGKLDGILLNGDLQPVAAPRGVDTNFQIAIFGTPVNLPTDNLRDEEHDDFFASNYTYGSSRPRYTIYNRHYEKIPLPMPNGSNNRPNGRMVKKAGAYKYESKYFDIAYRAQARGLSRKFAEFYSEQPVPTGY